MKVYIETARTDWSLMRVVKALEQYAPDAIELVPSKDKADLVVMHIIGRHDRNIRDAAGILASGRSYAIIQYALRSTQKPDTSLWIDLWRGARLVWSYYDLEAQCKHDWTPFDFNFYHAPLGVDSETFYPRDLHCCQFVIGTSGHRAVTESIREVAFATKRVGRRMLHIGPELKRGDDIICKSQLSDDELARLLSDCEFVACLRRTEGFELMAAEGLLCGARPICFDRDHYHQWYDPWAIFIPEGNRDEVIDSLEAVFRQGTEPVSGNELKMATELFDWERVVTGFWQAICEY